MANLLTTHPPKEKSNNDMNILYSEAINTVKTFKGNTVTTYKGNTVMTSKGYCHLKAIFLIPQVQVWFRGNC